MKTELKDFLQTFAAEGKVRFTVPNEEGRGYKHKGRGYN